jgi:hypothetical protein
MRVWGSFRWPKLHAKFCEYWLVAPKATQRIVTSSLSFLFVEDNKIC